MCLQKAHGGLTALRERQATGPAPVEELHSEEEVASRKNCPGRPTSGGELASRSGR